MPPPTWQLDPAHSCVRFSVRHLGLARVQGRLRRFAGELALDPDDPAQGTLAARLDAASLDTGDAERDAHLRSADFLDVARWPAIEFRAGRIARVNDRWIVVEGELTIRDVTRRVVLHVRPAGRAPGDGGERLAASARTTLSRAAFGLTWNRWLEWGGALVGDEIEVTIDVEAVRVADGAPDGA